MNNLKLGKVLRLSSVILVIAVVLGAFMPHAAKAQDSPKKEVIKVFVETTGNFLYKTLRSAFTEHERVYPVAGGRAFYIPAGDYGGTRISTNFNHKSWVPRHSDPVWVRLTIEGVDNVWLRNSIRIHMKADKWGKKDRDRGPGLLRHGSVFQLKYGTDGDRAYYFVERNSAIKGQHLPIGTYFKLERFYR